MVSSLLKREDGRDFIHVNSKSTSVSLLIKGDAVKEKGSNLARY